MISHTHGFIFIHIPKCAGTSIETAFGHRDGFTGRDGQDHRTLRMLEPVAPIQILRCRANRRQFVRRMKYPHKKCTRNPNNLITVTRRQFKRYFKFCFVRNPWARVVSAYDDLLRDERKQQRFGLGPDPDFDRFVYEVCGRDFLKPQLHWITNWRGEIGVDFVGRYEQLERDFGQVCDRLGVGSVSLPRSNAGRNRDYRSYFSTELADAVSGVYAEEIAHFGYTFE